MRRAALIPLVLGLLVGFLPVLAPEPAEAAGATCCRGGDLEGDSSQGGSAQGGEQAGVTAWVIGAPGGGVRPPSGTGVVCTSWAPAAGITPDAQWSDVGGFKIDPDGVVAVLYYRDCGAVRQVVWVRQEPPEVIARVALADIQSRLLQQPEVRLSPPGRGIVNLESWLSVVDPGAQSATAEIPGRSVTVTATVASSRWVLDDGNGAPVTLRCDGVGVAWTPADGERPAPCGHEWRWRSPDGSSPTVSVSITWDVSWVASNGMTGTLESIESAPAVVPYRIDEIQTIGTRG